MRGYEITSCRRTILAPTRHRSTVPPKNFPQRQHGEEGNSELGNDQNRGNGSEFRIHRHIVDEEIRQPHKVLTPREHDGEDRRSQQGPLHGSLHDEQAKDEEHHHEGTDIHRTRRARLLTPVLTYLLIDTRIIGIGLGHRCLIHAQGYRCTTLRIRDQQCPCLTDAIAPLGDIVTLQATVRLVSAVFLHQFTLAAHRLLTVLPGVIEVGEVDAHTDDTTQRTDCRCLRKTFEFVFVDGIHQPGDDEEEDDEQIIIGHLHVVRVDLECREDCRQQQYPEVFPAIGQHQSCDQRWQIS